MTVNQIYSSSGQWSKRKKISQGIYHLFSMCVCVFFKFLFYLGWDFWISWTLQHPHDFGGISASSSGLLCECYILETWKRCTNFPLCWRWRRGEVVMIIFRKEHSNSYTIIYIYIHPVCLYFWVWTLQKKAISIQNKGHLGSRYIFRHVPTLHTVDGRNPAPVEVGSFSYFLQGFIHPRWLFLISSINSSNSYIPTSYVSHVFRILQPPAFGWKPPQMVPQAGSKYWFPGFDSSGPKLQPWQPATSRHLCLS